LAFNKNITIMISSRCLTAIKKRDGTTSTLTGLRNEIKKQLEETTFFGREIFEVWISEDPQAPDTVESSWNECMEKVDECHFLLVLYAQEAGWAKRGGDIGICHAELQTAIDREPGKVFIINIEKALVSPSKVSPVEQKRNDQFIGYVNRINRFYEKASTFEEIIEKCKTVVREAVVRFVDFGKRESRRGKFSSGIALNWSRMNFMERKSTIEETILGHLIDNGGSQQNHSSVTLAMGKVEILVICHGVPGGMGVAAARELVGQPFLRDHDFIQGLDKHVNGPIHLIGVHKGVTETQARNQLGFPDAIIVEAPFGIYVADKIQKIQMIFLKNCRDESATKHNVQRFLDWIEETGESDFIRNRSISRRKIVDLITLEKE